MIRAHFGLKTSPFSHETPKLLAPQQEILDTLRVHCQQGGLCLVLGEPGTGKSVIKSSLAALEPKRLIVPIVNRTLHTYSSVLRILCESFAVDTSGRDVRCETRLIAETHRLNQAGKMLAPVIDDAHLMNIDSLRKIRLLFEDFPKNSNLILIAQPSLLTHLNLTIHDDLRSRVTYSAHVRKLAPETIEALIHDELDRVGLAHRSFGDDALALIIRSSEGILRRVRNLCIASLLECVRDQVTTVGLEQVNRVLLQPHWRQEKDLGR